MLPVGQPSEVFPVDHVYIRVLFQSRITFLSAAKHLHDPELLKMIPLFRFFRPHCSRNAQRRNDQHPGNVKVIQQGFNRCQRDHCLSQAHFQEESALRVRQDPLAGRPLIIPRIVYH